MYVGVRREEKEILSGMCEGRVTDGVEGNGVSFVWVCLQ